MKKQSYRVLGVMSGTSLDGIDIALIEFQKQEGWQFRIECAETFSYSSTWVNRLQEAVRLDPQGLDALDREYTVYLAGVINSFLAAHKVEKPDAICSHGHTIWHQPEKGITVQIGNRKELAALTGSRIVCDFRVQDVALGGQGAPLVPVGDKLLFADYGYCLNLGGFANVSCELNGNRHAYDICAVNTVLNYYARKTGQPYDAGGAMARNGNVHDGLLEALGNLSFYKAAPPKSLGIEWVEAEVLPLIDSFQLKIPDILATYTIHVAKVLSDALREGGDILVTGGGAYNTFLMEELSKRTDAEVIVPDDALVEYKEALIFALLGVLRLEGEINCLSSVTGASRDHSSGMVYEP